MRLIKHVMMIAGVAIPAMALAADSVTMNAGRWEETITVTRAVKDGVEIPLSLFDDGPSVSNSCLTAEDAASPARYFLAREADDSCVPTGTVADGRIDASAECTTKTSGPMKIRATGRYAPKSYQLDAVTDLKIGGDAFTVTMALVGRHVGTCRGDEE